jgi:magnesium-transporting ATPase (P-type)
MSPASPAPQVKQRAIVLDANNTLLRGCVLRNVEYVYGLVVYTGNQTKVRVKQQTKKTKKARVERDINKYNLLLVAMLVTLCVAGAIGYYLWNE